MAEAQGAAAAVAAADEAEREEEEEEEEEEEGEEEHDAKPDEVLAPKKGPESEEGERRMEDVRERRLTPSLSCDRSEKNPQHCHYASRLL